MPKSSHVPILALLPQIPGQRVSRRIDKQVSGRVQDATTFRPGLLLWLLHNHTIPLHCLGLFPAILVHRIDRSRLISVLSISDLFGFGALEEDFNQLLSSNPLLIQPYSI